MQTLTWHWSLPHISLCEMRQPTYRYIAPGTIFYLQLVPNPLMKDRGSHYYWPTVRLVIKLSKLQLVTIILLCLSQYSPPTLLLHPHHHHHHLQDLSISLYCPIWYPKHFMSCTLCEHFSLSFFSHSLLPRDVYVGSLHWENKQEIDRWLGWSSPFPKSRPENRTSKGK